MDTKSQINLMCRVFDTSTLKRFAISINPMLQHPVSNLFDLPHSILIHTCQGGFVFQVMRVVRWAASH